MSGWDSHASHYLYGNKEVLAPRTRTAINNNIGALILPTYDLVCLTTDQRSTSSVQ